MASSGGGELPGTDKPDMNFRRSLPEIRCQACLSPSAMTAHDSCQTGEGMRVVIDATPLLVRSAGVKNYLYHWILHLRRLAGASAIGTFPRMDEVRALTHQASVAGPLRTWSGLGALALSNH